MLCLNPLSTRFVSSSLLGLYNCDTAQTYCAYYDPKETLKSSLEFTLEGFNYDQTALVSTSTHHLGHGFGQDHDSLPTLLVKYNPTCSFDDLFNLGQLDVRREGDDAVLFNNVGLGEEGTKETRFNLDRSRFWVVSVSVGKVMRSSESSEESEDTVLGGSVKWLGGVLQGCHGSDQEERVVSRGFLRERSVCGVFLSKCPVSQMGGVNDSGQIDIDGLHVGLLELYSTGAAKSVSCAGDG